jgi:hypothetical protein
MGKKTPKAPTPPNPAVVAAAQTKSNQETARTEAALNRVNQVTPWGNVTYQDLGNDRWSQTVNLSPEEQQTYNMTKYLENQGLDIGRNVLGQVGQQFGQQMDLSGLTPVNTDFGAERDRMTEASFNRSKGFLDPRFESEGRALETKLAAQGITQGSDAYTRAVADYERNKAGAYQQAADSAVQMGASEANTLFGQNLTARQQGLGELESQRARPMNELAALMNLSSVGAPQTGPAAQVGVAPTDVIGANQMAYQGQLNNYNQQLQQQQGMLGGLFNLGGALGSAWIMSDVRVKEGIRRVGQTDQGLPVYTYRYKGRPETHMGVLAQEAREFHPEAVSSIRGILHVDYSRIGG